MLKGRGGLALAMTVCAIGGIGPAAGEREPPAITWRLDNLRQIGGHAVTVAGEPAVVDTEIGGAVAFDGRGDGLFLDVSPLAGLLRFTVEIVFKPARDGDEEQRFLHFEDLTGGNRALIELRMRSDQQWALDTYLRSGDAGLTLLDRERAHPSERWHVAALTYDGKTMSHFVDGRRELSGRTVFAPLGAGRTSIGVRLNRVSWFKGLIHSITVTPEALSADRLMSLPSSVNANRRVIPLWRRDLIGADSGPTLLHRKSLESRREGSAS